MSTEAVVYFLGPETKWSKKVSEREIISHRSYRFTWLANLFARSAHGSLDPARCGYVILRDGVELKHVEPVAE